MLRPLFLSHGAPTLPFEDVAARHFLKGLATTMPRPRAILVVSAHWETRVPTVNAVERNRTIHDFGGFPDALYRLTYPAPGDPQLADRVADLLAEAGLPSATDTARGLDHGAWVPLMLAWPELWLARFGQGPLEALWRKLTWLGVPRSAPIPLADGAA